MSPEVHRTVAPYLQIAHALRREIMAGVLAPGDLIPSERELTETWKVSRMTASKALGSLRSEGLIYSEQGRGTYVSKVPEITAAERYGRSVNPLGKSYGPTERSEIRRAELVRAPNAIAAALAVEDNSEVIKRYRIISNDTRVVELSTSWFAGDLVDSCPALLMLDRLPNGMLRYIKSQTGRVAAESLDTYEAGLLDSVQCEDLGIPTDQPSASLRASHRILDKDSSPLVYIQAVYRPGYKLVQTISLH